MGTYFLHQRKTTMGSKQQTTILDSKEDHAGRALVGGEGHFTK